MHTIFDIRIFFFFTHTRHISLYLQTFIYRTKTDKWTSHVIETRHIYLYLDIYTKMSERTPSVNVDIQILVAFLLLLIDL